MPPWKCGALLLAVSALVAACQSAPPLAHGNVETSTVAEAAPAPFRLSAGDRVFVGVFAHPENSTPETGVLLDPDGRLDLPLVGPVPLAGLDLEGARERVRAELARYVREPRVTLSLVEERGRRFYLFGEVENTGAYPLDRPLNALQALSLGGGFQPGADRKQVALLRGTKEHLEVYFFDGATPGTDGLVAVQPDDLIFVRLSGAGTFRDQILPIVQTLVPPLTAAASLIVVADSLND